MKDSLGRQKAITVQEAKKILLEFPLKPLSVETIGIDSAYGRVLAEDILSPESLPGFDRSSMDGYAVVAEDTYGASESLPVYLRLTGEIKMGQKATIAIKRGEAAGISTGGMLPPGANAVVMFEHVNRIDNDTIEVMKQVAPGENVIASTEDVKEGDILFYRGHKLRPQDIGALAGVGITEVKVYKRPVVAIISTGDEVVPAEQTPSPGQVRDVNSYILAGLVIQNGCIAVKTGIVRDDPMLLKEAIQKAIHQADMVLISGGSSVGTRDFTERVINELGHPGVLFHGVMMKPGKPFLGAVVDGVFVLGMPGHPAAVSVCFEVFVRDLLQKLSGTRPRDYLPVRRTVKAHLSHNLPSVAGREDYVRVRIDSAEGGKLVAEPILGKSGLIRTLIYADGFVVIPRQLNGMYKDEVVEVMLFDP